METLLVKIFATALALSQVTTTPDAVKTEFSRDRDQHQVAQLLQAGCTHMMHAFDIENFNLDDVIATAMDDPQAIGGGNNAFRGINFADLRTAYRQFCSWFSSNTSAKRSPLPSSTMLAPGSLRPLSLLLLVEVLVLGRDERITHLVGDIGERNPHAVVREVRGCLVVEINHVAEINARLNLLFLAA
jgi:hypothetical protein